MFNKFKDKLETLNMKGVLLIQVVLLVSILSMIGVREVGIVIAIIWAAAIDIIELQERILRRLDNKNTEE